MGRERHGSIGITAVFLKTVVIGSVQPIGKAVEGTNVDKAVQMRLIGLDLRWLWESMKSGLRASLPLEETVVVPVLIVNLSVGRPGDELIEIAVLPSFVGVHERGKQLSRAFFKTRRKPENMCNAM